MQALVAVDYFATVTGVGSAARIYHLSQVLKRAHKLDGSIIEPRHLHASLFFRGELQVHAGGRSALRWRKGLRRLLKQV